MARQRKTPRAARKKSVKVALTPRPARKSDDEAEPYSYLDKFVGKHKHLDQARVALAWMLDVKADIDGHLILGKCKKATDLDREFREFDFVILLNATAWKHFSKKQRAALVDHELHHAGIALDKKSGDPILDERNRRVYRIKKHDIEEFKGVVERHGLYKHDLEEFAQTCIQAPLYKAEADADEAAKPKAKPPESSNGTPKKPAAKDDESWRTVPIGEALQGLGSRAYAAFEEKKISTLGDFTDFQAKHGEWWAKELPGVGPETQTKIADAAEAFWKTRAA